MNVFAESSLINILFLNIFKVGNVYLESSLRWQLLVIKFIKLVTVNYL